MPPSLQNGAQSGAAFSRHHPSGPGVAADADASPASSLPSSPSGSPRQVILHGPVARRPRPQARGDARPTRLDRRTAQPAAVQALAPALGRASRANEALAWLARQAPVSQGLRRWAGEAWGRLGLFLRLVERAEQTALLGGMESLQARAERKAALEGLAAQLEAQHRLVQASLAQRPALPVGAVAGAGGVQSLPALQEPGLGPTCEAVLAHTLAQIRLRQDFLAGSERHHPFYLPRMLQSKALYWQAAAEVLRSLPGGPPLARRPAPRRALFASPPAAAPEVPSLLVSRSSAVGPSPAPARSARASGPALLDRYRGHFDSHVRALARLAEMVEHSPGQRLYDPGEVLGLKSRSPRREVEAAVDALLAGRWRPGIHNQLLPERELALVCLQAAVASAQAADPDLHLPDAQALAARYAQACSQQLRVRPNAVVRSQLLLPAAGAPVAALGRRVHRQLMASAEQRPAIAVSESLQTGYLADGVQGAHCHERSQHKHCTNLYLSRFEAGGLRMPGQAAGESLLTLTRHGVLSPLGLSRRGLATDSKGRPQISDADLGRAALDLAEDPGVGASELSRLRRMRASGTLDEAAAWEAAARLVRQDAGRGGWARRLPAFLGGGQLALIDRLHAAAGLRRAREAAEVALASLPDAVLADIATRAARGEAPRLRLASVSLLTPDPFRHVRDGVRDRIDSDELAMWQDQRQAWETLAREPQLVPLPVLDAQGRVLRDEEGRLRTTRSDGRPSVGRVRFEVLPMNVPVNEHATALPTGAFVATAGANRRAIEALLGRDLLGWTHWARNPGRIRGWVGEALRQEADPARRQALVTLSTEVVRIYMTNAHHSAGQDPYKLAKRLIVLCSLLPGTATLINCKSGKDRTSEAEAQARQLALEIALRQGQAPAEAEPLTPLRQSQLAVLHEAGGSREIQWWNTNTAGTKLGGQALMAMYGIRDKAFFTPRKVHDALAGKDAARASYLGTSKLTQS